MEQRQPLRLAIVGADDAVRQFARHSIEFGSLRVAVRFSGDDGVPPAATRWAAGNPTDEADVLCVLDEQACSVSLAEQALGSGLHVWCAGPLTRDMPALERVASRAESQGLTLVAGGSARYTASAQIAADALASGRLGRPVCLRYAHLGAEVSADWPLAEAIALANSLIDDALVSVYARATGGHHTSVSLGYGGGATALLALGAPLGTVPIGQLMLLGNRGAVYDGTAPTTALLLPTADSGSAQAFTDDHVGGALTRWADQCAQAIQAGSPPPMTISAARTVAEAVDRVEHSLREGGPVALSQVGGDR